MPCAKQRSPLASVLTFFTLAMLLPVAAAAQPGSVSGAVTDAATGLPIANITIIVFNGALNPVGTAVTNAAGNYSISNIPPGRYAVTAAIDGDGAPNSTAGYLAEVYPDVQCFGSCPDFVAFTGELITVTAGGTTSGINFALAMGGRITGAIRSAATGNPIPNVRVTALLKFPDFMYELGKIGDEGLPANSAMTNASGVFTIANLPTDTYYLLARFDNNQDFIPEIYDNIPCLVDCGESEAVERGAPIAVTAGATVSGKDFALETGGTFSGTVTNAVTGVPIANVGVAIYALSEVGPSDNQNAWFIGIQQTNGSGVYTARGLPTGTYYAHTFAPQAFTNKIYGDILCPSNCLGTTTVESGTPISVTAGAATTGRDFVLEQGGSITGVVRNQNTSNAIQFVQVTVVARVGNQFVTKSANTNASGIYTVNGLPTETYWVYTNNPLGFINEIYDNIPCRGQCTSAAAAATGTPIQVTAGAPTSGVNFLLQPGGGISGTVTDAANGSPLADIGVDLWYQSGGTLTRIFRGETNGTGQFGFGGLMAGNYLVVTSGGYAYVNEVYNNIPCLAQEDDDFGENGSCAETIITSGTPIAVTPGSNTTGVNIALSPMSIVRGTATDASSGTPLDLVMVVFLRADTGGYGGVGFGVRSGQYVAALPSGDYVAFSYNIAGYVNEIYDNVQCPGLCSPATAVAQGTRITVPPNAIVNGINFALDLRTTGPPAAPREFAGSVNSFNAQFNWLAPPIVAAAPATSYVLEAGLSPGATFFSIPVTVTSFASAVPPGTYYVRVRGRNAAGTGPASNELRLVVDPTTGISPPEPPTTPAAFMTGARLTFTWADALTGGTTTSYLVEAGSATGLANIATLPVQGRTFTFNTVPPGFYFLRVRAVNSAGVSAPSAEAMIVVGGVPSPPGAPDFTSLTAAGSTVTLTWTAPVLGPTTSYVIEAGSAKGLANIASLNTGSTATTASFSGVPAGTYYLRLRAVNAQGPSVVSNERVITIP